MVFDKMGLYFASGKLKWTTENYVTLVVGAGADLGGCAWGVHPPPPEMTCGFLLQLVFSEKICGFVRSPVSYVIP